MSHESIKVCTHCLLSAAQHGKKIVDDHKAPIFRPSGGQKSRATFGRCREQPSADAESNLRQMQRATFGRCREQFVDRTGEQLQSGASELSDEEANDKALKMMGV